MRRALFWAVVVTAVAAHGAAAHTGSSRGMKATVDALRPNVPGLRFTVRGGDDQLVLRNATSSSVTVLGYSEEPFLRFGPDGVWENQHSPSTYISRERFGRVDLPAKARVGAAPEWKKVSAEPLWAWHDHRIHWMSPDPPPIVAQAPGRRHHVFDWKVPLAVDGKRIALVGSLDYTPPRPPAGSGSDGFPVAALAGGVAVGVALATTALVLLRGRRQPEARRTA
jgi:hypothetical protein